MIFTIKRLRIKYLKDLEKFENQILKEKPEWFVFDTETNGVHIILNKPFLYTFGFLSKDKTTIYTYSLDLERTSKAIQDKVFNKLFEVMRKDFIKKVVGHHVSFDLHMSANINRTLPEDIHPKLSDSMFYIRLGEDALSNKKGGVPLALKDYVYRHIWSGAKEFESKLKTEITTKRKMLTKELLEAMKDKELIVGYCVSGKEKRWTKGMINNLVADKLLDLEDLPKTIRPIIEDWQKKEAQTSNYRLLDRDNVTYYAHYDIVLTLLVLLKNAPEIEERKMQQILAEEEEAIIPIYEMERSGKFFNLPYALEAKKRTKRYIIELEQSLVKMTPDGISATQSIAMKNYLNDTYQLELESTDKEHLMTLKNSTEIAEIRDFTDTVLELRTLIKWYSTYLVKWIEEAQLSPKNYIYPTYKQVGTATGRVSSPFQQFPREPIYKRNGEELYDTRKMLKCPEDYTLVYFDYSQMELRMQANYTVLISGGDINLCRAFIPFKCHLKTGEENIGKYYLDEDPETEWHEVNLHDLTTKTAFGIDESHPDWKHFRSISKSGNFAMIYGASPYRLQVTLHISSEQAHNLYNAFYTNYPGIRDYDNYIRYALNSQGYIENLFGRRYYGVTPHDAKNYLIQGSCADYTKKLLPEIYQLIKPTKSKLENYLHDEFSFRIHKSENYLIPKIKEIMEQLDSPIIMAVDVETSTTVWSDKRGIQVP